MKKGIIIIVLITLSLILFRPPKINAAQIDGWAETLPALGRVDIKECTSQSTCSTNKSVYIDTMVNANYIERNYATIDWQMSIGSNGYVIISPWSAKANYLYNINYYVCFNKNIDSTDINTMYFTSSGNPINNGNLYNSNPGRSAMSVVPIIDGTAGAGFGRCYRYSNYVVPENNYNWAALRIQSSTVVSGVKASVISLDIRELGLWDEKFEDIINNSGLASAESVDQVQESVDRVEEAITGDYDYNDTPSEELDGKEELDDLKEKEEELLGNLDFSGAENLEITIQPESASFIWQIVDSLRSMSGKIVLLITSILSLGIIKMILNR